LPFDTAREQLPPAYIGHSVQLVYDLMNREQVSGEGRIRAAEGPRERTWGERSPLKSAMSLDSTYAFQVKPTENLYNSRDHSLQVYCELSTILSGGARDNGKRGFTIRYVPHVDNHYTYMDAGGAKIEIEEVKFRDYSVAVENFDEFPVERGLLPSMKQLMQKQSKKGIQEGKPDDEWKRDIIVGTLNVAPGEVKQLKESIRVLVVCKLTDPYITSETVHREGTEEKPGQYHAEHLYLHVRCGGLWFYDFVTGRILMKMKPDEARERS
jgi:hypothetical protein